MNTLSLGAKSFEMPINEKWTVTYFKEDISRAELRFETGEYPVLGVKIVSLDDPKLDISDKLKSHLFDPVLLETNPNLEIKNINNNIFWLEYEANLESGEKAKVWRIATLLGSRTVRVVTIALSWMSGGEADIEVKKILNELSGNILKCTFSKDNTDLDKEALALAKIARLKFKLATPWDGLSFRLPNSWPLEINKKDKTMACKVTGYDDAMFFLNFDEILLTNNMTISMEYMQKIAANLGSDINVKNISLHATENNMYLISCHKNDEIKEENLVMKNYFWHFFAPRKEKLFRLNFTYAFPENKDFFLDNLVGVLDANIKTLTFL